MRKFTVLLKKELRELLTAQILVPFALTVLVFVMIGNLVGQQSEQADATRRVAILDLDATATSAMVIEAVESAGFAVHDLEGVEPERVTEALAAEDIRLALVVPEGFEEGLSSFEPQELQTYAVIKSFSFAATHEAGLLSAVLAAVNRGLSTEMLAGSIPGADPSALLDPVRSTATVVVGEAAAQASVEEVFSFVSSQTTFIPIILFVVIVFASQMIATTIANEKENKTLETLLAAPIDRTALVAAKMVAASLVALLSAGVYLFGMRYYMESLSAGFGESLAVGAGSAGLAELGLALGGLDYALLGLTLFLSILAALAIAVILGAFAENVRAVQSLLAPLMVVLMIPYFLTLLVDIAQLAPVLRWFVYAIPFSHAFTAAPALFLDDYRSVWLGIGYLAVWCVGLVAVAGRIFSTDRILTMKLDLRRKSRG